MSLLAAYSNIVKIKTSFNLMNSVYLDLAIAAAGVLFFHYWDRIPEETVLEELSLPKSRKVFQWSLAVEGIFTLTALFGAERFRSMEAVGLKKSLCDFAVGLSGELGSGQNAFLDAMADLGVLGAGFLILLVTVFVMRGEQAKGEAPPLTRIIGGLFLALLFLMPVSEAVAPLFIVAAAYAIYGKKESEKKKGEDKK